MKEIAVRTSQRNEMIDITGKVNAIIHNTGVQEGLCCVFVPHTTAAVTINEDADPSVVRDMLMHMKTVAPERGDYRHSEGNSDAHIKSSLFGCEQTIIIHEGRLTLGTWQGVYFCEFDGPRSRKVWVQVLQTE